jgi:uncharacterized OsmC-like protein/alpha/beta superfamily hydrolase
MPTKTFDFTGAQGQRLSGRLDLPEGPVRAYALFAHCFTCAKSSLAATHVSRALAALGVGTLRFDFTGLGASEGTFADAGFSGDVADLHAAAQAMAAAGIGPSLLIGHSLGGAAALAAAGDMAGVTAVATIAAPFKAEHVTRQFGAGLAKVLEEGEAAVDLGGRPFRIKRSFLEDLQAQDPKDRIGKLRRALLVLHSPVDQVVGVENAAEIFLAARHPKSFVCLDHADHLLTRPEDGRYAASVIAAWAGRYLPIPVVETLPADEGVRVATTGAGKFQVSVQAGPTRFLADEPKEVGGLGSGPTPYELVSAGLGACTAITLRLYADQKAWPLTGVSVKVMHCKVKDRTPADVFAREITLEGPLDGAQQTRLMEIAEKCPVHRTLEAGSRVETALAGAADDLPRDEDPAEHAREVQRTCVEAG